MEFIISGAGEERANGEYVCEFRHPEGAFFLKKGDVPWFLPGGLVLISANLSLGPCLWGGKATRIEGSVFFCSLPFCRFLYWWVLQETSALWPFARS